MKRRFFTGIATAAMLASIAVPVANNLSFSNNAQTKAVQASTTTTAFLNATALKAEKSGKKYGVYPSLMLAQAALESAWGGSTLATQAHNLFGMKADSTWSGASYTVRTAEQTKNGAVYYIYAPFRKYSSYTGSFDDYGRKMRNTIGNGGLRYRKTWIENASSPAVAAKAIKAAGYATDVNYASKLISHINNYNLTKYDPMISTLTYKAKVAKSGATYLYPTDYALSPKKSYVNAGRSVTVSKTITYYNGAKRMYLKGLGWVNGDALTTGSSQAPAGNAADAQTSAGQAKILMHDSYVYDSNGQKTKDKRLKAGKTVVTYGTVTLNGATYYRINSASANQFVNATNFDGTKRTLKKNAYLYNSTGKRYTPAKKWKKGTKHQTYGWQVKIKGKYYYVVGLNQYVRKGNF